MVALETGVISEESARQELWISFGSLVRSYVAAAQIGLEPPLALVAQPEEHELHLIAITRTIKLTLDPGRVDGYWVIYQQPAADDAPFADGAFRIGLDGLVEWTGLPGRQEMDAVAELLATLLLE